MEFEEALKLVGEFGLFQWLLITYLGFFMVPMHSITMAVHVFTLLEPPHWCRQPELEETFNLTPKQARELGVPRDSDGKWSSCTMYEVNMTALGSWTPGRYFNESFPSRIDLPVVPCRSGWHYDYSLVYPTIVSQLDWVCGENWKAYISHTVFFGAMSFGVVLFGALSDIFGRVPVTVVVYMLSGVGAVVTFFTENFYVFLGTRVLVGGVLLAIYTNPFVLALEYMPPKKRMLMGGVFGLVYPLLGAALPWVAYAIGHWRLLNAVIVVPAILGTIVSMFVPESIRWLLSKGKTDKAKKIMRTIGKINGKDVERKALDSLQPPEKSDSATSSALLIFKYPCLRRSFVIMVLVRLIACLGNQVGQLYAATATDDPFVMSSATNAVDILGIWLAVPMADKFGRKTTALCSYALACLCYLASGQVYAHRMALLCTLMVGRALLTIAYDVGSVYGAEIDPTEIRTQALSIRQAFGSLGRILGSHVVQLAVYGRFVPLFILGGLSCVATLLTLPLPETNNRKLPETFEEAEAMHHQTKKGDKDEPKTVIQSTDDKVNNNSH
nr:beta-alanine transporter-like [Rhipicephalus microplus]